jgi:hypothetical protein
LKNKGFVESIFIQEERAYHIQVESSEISFTIAASKVSPIINPALIIKNWNVSDINLKVNGEIGQPGKQFRYGTSQDTSGKKYMIDGLEIQQ